MNRPDHMRAPAWNGLDVLFAPSPITWETETSGATAWLVAYIAGHAVATLQARPSYCDRGHWKVLCELPYIDGADGFPRYYMSKDTAMRETEAFLRWRLWKERSA